MADSQKQESPHGAGFLGVSQTVWDSYLVGRGNLNRLCIYMIYKVKFILIIYVEYRLEYLCRASTPKERYRSVDYC